MENSDDRRTYRRLESVHLVSYTLKDKEGNEFQKGVSCSMDISANGMRIEVQERIPLNTKIELEVSIMDEINSFKGEVVHVEALEGGKRFGAGIKIIV